MSPIERIRRQSFKMTQAAFAAVAGVTQATVSRWEKGECEPTRREMAKIRAAAQAAEFEWSDGYFFDDPPAAVAALPLS